MTTTAIYNFDPSVYKQYYIDDDVTIVVKSTVVVTIFYLQPTLI